MNNQFVGNILRRFMFGMLGVAMVAVSACGQKGPLYLPEQDKQQVMHYG